MKKIKTVLKIVGIIIAIVIIGVLILKISVTKKYDGKEIFPLWVNIIEKK